MGSWFGTCGVSQLPIMDGDNVAIFFMKKNDNEETDHGGTVHSDNFYVPVSPAIFGKYADYSRIDDIRADRRIINTLYGNINKDNDLGKLIDEKSKKKGLYIMLVHLDIYKKMIEEFGDREEFFTKGLPYKNYIRNEIVEYLIAKKEYERSIESGRFIRHNPRLDFAYTRFGNALDLFDNFMSNVDLYDLDIENDSLVSDVVNIQIFRQAMQESRKLWIPQAGQGSQDLDYEVSKIIGEFVMKRERELEEW